MTARVVPKHEVARILDLLKERGIPVHGLECRPGGKVFFNLSGASVASEGGGANPWDAVLDER